MYVLPNNLFLSQMCLTIYHRILIIVTSFVYNTTKNIGMRMYKIFIRSIYVCSTKLL